MFLLKPKIKTACIKLFYYERKELEVAAIQRNDQ